MQQERNSSDFAKTQILITDIPKDKFSEKWPTTLENEIFRDHFPNLRLKLQYFTPLQFLNRIVIIMLDQDSTEQIYQFLKDKVISKPMKIFMTESLLGNQQPRANSCDDAIKSNIEFNDSTNPFRVAGNDSPETVAETFANTNLDTTTSPLASRSNSNSSIKVSRNKPILSLDTNPLKTGISSSSLSFGSASLSPDRASIDSPTLLRVSKNDKLHYYQEPLPKNNEPTSDNNDNNAVRNGSNSCSNSLTSDPIPENRKKIGNMTPFESNESRTPTSIITRDSEKINDDEEDKLSVDTNINNNDNNSSNMLASTAPKSPSITINRYFE